ncbi:hypothetical protein [Janthinobacterium agaricidamnosum]|uniref:Putative lipoprotein n=1 Tax=Janthinobacterium agaricidamnosum NBRC 102515 = DSM 9628 TaxID=1349767 RepID=W0V4K2_9BURK|nr:hypothetical protein [Janthinobacterium agaricidamnosum]CDG82202.1 putative lipoprotein [Janthinobacterium agaricidamnosum NBRC 102515 = DSM 9628]
MKPNFLALILIAAALLGCAETPRRLQTEEEALHTNGSITRLFHSALYYPFEITPRFDGYLVGIEKVRRPPGGIDVRNRKEYGLENGALQAKFDDSKVMAVTHVIRHFADARQFNNCTLFNAYIQSSDSVNRQLVRACDLAQEMIIRHPNDAFPNSWKALDELRDDIGHRIASRLTKAQGDAADKAAAVFGTGAAYTHIIVLVMGWNTVQEEAVRNFNSLMWNIEKAHKRRPDKLKAMPGLPFNPLVIGVTWPSQWSSNWLDPAIKIVSFPTKAGDADEVGMSWLGVLLHDTLPAVREAVKTREGYKKDLPVVVLGHSFGAKASSVAACAGPAVVRPEKTTTTPLADIDVLVNLEPAYLSERIFGRTSWLHNVVYYPKGCPRAQRFVITASASDRAVPLPFWGTYLGEEKSYRKFCAADHDGPRLAHCAVADHNGEVAPKFLGTSKNIYYVDASELISENAYETGGGSHSDIYRFEHGRLIYAAIMGEGIWAKSE